MAESNKKFLGFKQVLQSTYEATAAADKVGFIWFVRPDTTTTTTGKIYFGSREYGSVDEATWTKINTTLADFLTGEQTGTTVKQYVDNAVAGKNVSASGESGDNALVTASAANNEVTVASTSKLQNAVAAAETALQSVSTGTAHDYVTVTVGTKDSNKNQSIEVAVTTAAVSGASAGDGLADAADVKDYVDGEITKLVGNATESGDTLGELENRIKVLETGATNITVEKLATPETSYAATYVVKQNGTQVGDSINIPKDYLVKSASIKVCETADVPVSGLVPGDKYIDFVVNAKDGQGDESHIYLPVADLAHIYSAGNGIEISANDVVSAKVVAANGLSVDANGIAMAAVTTTDNGAMLATDKVKLDGIEAGAQVNDIEGVQLNGVDVTLDGNKKANIVLPTATESGASHGVEVTVAQSEGKITGVTVVAPDFEHTYATIDDLNNEATARTEADEALDARLDVLEAKTGLTENALQSISHGKDSTYVTTTIGAKTSKGEGAGYDQTVGVAVAQVAVSGASAAGQGLADAYDVKQHVAGAIEALDGSVAAVADKYVASVDEVNGVISGTTAFVDEARLANYSNTGAAPILASGDSISGAFSKIDSKLQELGTSGLQRVNAGNGIAVTDPVNNRQDVSLKTWQEAAGASTPGRAEIKFEQDGSAYVEVVMISGDDVE